MKELNRYTKQVLEDFTEGIENLYIIGEELNALIDDDYGGRTDEFMAALTSSADYATLKMPLKAVLNHTFFEGDRNER